jgi:hypothetical protein
VSAAEHTAAEARDAQLRAEGELAAARKRTAELERQLAESTEKHRTALDAVRETESARVERILSQFALTRPPAAAPAEHAARVTTPTNPTDDVLVQMRRRIEAGQITRGVREQIWYIGTVAATRPAAYTLDWMLSRGLLAVDQRSDPAPVMYAGDDR